MIYYYLPTRNRKGDGREVEIYISRRRQVLYKSVLGFGHIPRAVCEEEVARSHGSVLLEDKLGVSEADAIQQRDG